LQPCIKIAFFKSSSDLRNWFETHHATAEELWVGYYKKNSGKPSISWFESVDEQPYDIPEVIKRAITNVGSPRITTYPLASTHCICAEILMAMGRST
jgi:hypothetical protein